MECSKRKERWKKVVSGNTKASLDVGIMGATIWDCYRELANPDTNVQTTIDKWIPKVDGKIKTFEDEKKAYK